MKPVAQTRFGDQEGNCFAACVASIFELPIEAVPDFDPAGGRWRQQVQDFCRERGLGWMQVRLGDAWLPDDEIVIAGGKSPRGISHAIVWRGGRMIHDPHPSGAGIELPPDHFDLFVALDPSRWPGLAPREEKP